MRTRKPITRRERGSALTEFAITIPVFTAMIWGSLYLTDLGILKLKAQEVTRYGAWAFAVRPLSDYEELRHTNAYNDARASVTDELDDVYPDLDGAKDRYLVPGRFAENLSGIYQGSTFRNQQVQILPDFANIEFNNNPLSSVSMVLGLLGVGNSTSSTASNTLGNLAMNTRGQITSIANVQILPPVRPDDAAQALALAKSGKSRGADLTRWFPMARPMRDTDGSRMEYTLIADSWRLSQGYTAHPKNGDAATRHYGNVVDEVSKNAITALPFGQIFAMIAQLEGFTDNIPPFLNVLIGIPPEAPSAHLFSRPYAHDRQADNKTGAPASGQTDIIKDAEGDNQEGGVRNFETGAFIVDADDPSNSGYVESFDERGPYFMGCRDAEERGCWE